MWNTEFDTIFDNLITKAASLGAFSTFIDDYIGDGKMMGLFPLNNKDPDHIDKDLIPYYEAFPLTKVENFLMYNGFVSIDAIVYINNFGIRIYHDSTDNGLNLFHQFIPEGASKIAYLYHKGIHFQALIPD